MTAKKSMTRWSIGRFARWTGGGLAGVLALIFALVFILLLPPVRGKVLVRVVRDVGTVLPGDLTVGDSA